MFVLSRLQPVLITQVQPNPFNFDLKPRPSRQSVVEAEYVKEWASKGS